MNRFTSASLQSGILRYKNLTVGDVRPDATTKLYKRMFKGTSRKYIPVKDVTSDTMGRELNAYLINPEYIDKSVIDPDTVSRQLKPAPVVRAVQYSRLTYTRPRTSISKRTIDKTADMFSYAAALGQKAIASVKKAAVKMRNTTLRSPLSRTYSLQKGMSLHKRQKTLTKVGGLVAIASFGIIGLQGIDFQQPITQPAPFTTSTTNSVVENPLSSVGTSASQPIPIYDDTTSSAAKHSNSNTVQSQANYQSAEAAQQKQAPAALPVQSTEPAAVSGPSVATLPSDIPNQPSESVIIDEPIISATPEIALTPVINTDPVLTPIVDTAVDTTSQTVEAVTNLVGGLLE